MNEENKNTPDKSEPKKKPGLFGKMILKLDESMKQKAEEQSKQGGCCGGDDNGKGGKCC